MATLVVTVLEGDGSLRLCGDFKVTLNTASKVDQYPLLKVEDMFTNLKDGYWFTKLDLQEAYCHVRLNEESKKAAMLNTHKRLFSYNLLPYEKASVPAIFQSKMEAVLKDIPGTQVFLDDILVTEHQHEFGTTQRKVLSALRDNGIRLRKERCIFGEEGVTYLGHRIPEKVCIPVKKKWRPLRRPLSHPASRNFVNFWASHLTIRVSY